MVDKTLDQRIPAALEALAVQVMALDVTALEELQGGQQLGGTAARWVRQIVTMKEQIATDVDSARRITEQLASMG